LNIYEYKIAQHTIATKYYRNFIISYY